MYELLGICLVLTALLGVNALASLIVGAGWSFAHRWLQKLSAATRAEILFALRIFPPVLAFIVITALLIPSYLRYEPYATAEAVSTKLAALAVLSAAGLGLALCRVLRSWTATRRLLREWTANARQIDLHGMTLPTFAFRHSFPIIAVVGMIKPRLFVGEKVLESLTQEELAAAIAHESGHLVARDNLKRVLLRISRDALMLVPCGRSLDRAWAEASESAADEYAAQQNPDIALNLASALIRIARMVPVGAKATMPVASFLVGAESCGIKARIRHLIEIAATEPARQVHHTLGKVWPFISLTIVAVPAIVVALNSQVLLTVHTLIEDTVRLLS